MSLLLGAVALIVGLRLFFLPPTATGQQLPVIPWNAAAVHIDTGTGTPSDQDLHLRLNETGRAIVRLPARRLESGSYPFLHLALEDSAENLTILILWTTVQTGENTLSYQLEDESRESVWLATRELRGWTGDISSLSLELAGQPGDEVIIRDFSVFPTSLSRQLQAIYSDWTSFVPWQRSAINTHSGVTSVSSFYPAPLTALFFMLSVIAYGLLLLLFRTKTRFNWSVIGLLFLSCWICLDLAWQFKLLRQLEETHTTFSGKNTPEKLAVGPDAELVKFITEVKQHLQPTDSRVFVSSTDDYLGLRGAYYLFPHNVYWVLRGPALPNPNHFHSGDYIVLVEPTAISFDPLKNNLLTPKNKTISVEPVISGRMGSLFRVN